MMIWISIAYLSYATNNTASEGPSSISMFFDCSDSTESQTREFMKALAINFTRRSAIPTSLWKFNPKRENFHSFKDSKETIESSIESNFKKSTGLSNITAALSQASDEVIDAGSDNSNSVVILVTDGKQLTKDSNAEQVKESKQLLAAAERLRSVASLVVVLVGEVRKTVPVETATKWTGNNDWVLPVRILYRNAANVSEQLWEVVRAVKKLAPTVTENPTDHAEENSAENLVKSPSLTLLRVPSLTARKQLMEPPVQVKITPWRAGLLLLLCSVSSVGVFYSAPSCMRAVRESRMNVRRPRGNK